jgi:hypothetical protein
MKGAVRCGAIVGNASLMSFSRGGERAVDEEDGALSLCHRPEEMPIIIIVQHAYRLLMIDR